MRYHIVEQTSFSCIYLFLFFPFLILFSIIMIMYIRRGKKRNCLNFILLRIPTLVLCMCNAQFLFKTRKKWRCNGNTSTFPSPFSILFIRWILNICLFTIILHISTGLLDIENWTLGGFRFVSSLYFEYFSGVVSEIVRFNQKKNKKDVLDVHVQWSGLLWCRI